jgi:ABC-type lipoprotein export system ATPase subunit
MSRSSALDKAAIVTEQLTRSFPSGQETVTAVKDVGLTVAKGEAVAITGPSGSGKTTLLNLISGLDRPTAGRIVVLDNDLGQMSERALTSFRAKHFGLVFQDPHLLPGLSALENVALARLPFEKRSYLNAESRKLLKAVGLGHRLSHPPSRLSSGERQRVGLARALLGQPELLIADEPTGNLDANTAEDLIELLDELRHELGITLIVATHDPAVAAVADRVVRLAGGTIASDRRVPDYPAVETHTLQ